MIAKTTRKILWMGLGMLVLPLSQVWSQQPGAPGTVRPPFPVQPGTSPVGGPAVAPPPLPGQPNTLPPTGTTPSPAGPTTPRKPSNSSAKSDDHVSVQFPSTPLSEVLDFYQQLTGKRTIRDPHLENATVSIETNGDMTKAQAIEFMEKSLLLSGYAIVPSGDTMVKVIAFEAGRNPASERVNMILREADLPKTDEVVTYLLPLQYLKSDEAAQAFSQIIPVHAYGKLVAVPNARALVVTENSNTIKAYIDLTKQVDLPPTETTFKTIQMERADAEEVSKALAELLGITAGSTSTKSGQPGAPPKTGVRTQQPSPQPGAPGAAPQVNPVASVGGESDASQPKIMAIPRTNSIFVMARPIDIEYIESLVQEFDAPSNIRGFVSRKLRYMDVVDFVNVAKDALLGGAKEGEGSKLKEGEQQKTTSTTTPANNSGYGNNSYGAAGLFGGGGMGGGYSGFSGGSTLQETQMPKTQSIFVGKTLVIVEPSAGLFYASGPPEQLRMLERLADELDVRQPQILLSAIIGQFTLSDDFQFGLDWVRTLETFGNGGNVGNVSGSLNNTGIKPVDFTSFSKLSDFPAASGLTVYGQIGKYANGFLTTLESTKRFHVLQRPCVATVNHKLANISTGQQIAIPGQTYSTGTTTTNTAGIYSTTTYIPVTLSVDIIPHIYANNEVKLEFNQTNNDVSGFTTISGNQVPNLSTQSLKNTVIVPNGGTVLLGGLITERDTKNQSGLPFLVRIPLLKYLFGNTTKNKERDELLIFVQPKIITDGADYVQEQAQIGKSVNNYINIKSFGKSEDVPPAGTEIPKAQPVQEAPSTSGKKSKGVNLDSRFGSSGTK